MDYREQAEGIWIAIQSVKMFLKHNPEDDVLLKLVLEDLESERRYLIECQGDD